MFKVHCEVCDNTRLFGPRRIIGMDNTDRGITIHFRCFCGGEATVLTGRATTSPVAAGTVDELAPADASALTSVPAFGDRVLATCGADAA